MLVFHLTSFEVDIGQGIEFGHHYIDIVGANAVRETHNGFTFVSATYGVKFAARYLEVLSVEIGCNHVNTARIAAHHYAVGEVLRLEMKVKNRAIGIDNQLRVGYYSFIGVIHICSYKMVNV